MNRVVITAAEPVCAIGIGSECFADALAEGESGVSEITAFDHSRYNVHSAAYIEDFDVDDFLPSPKNYLDRNSELSFGAFSLALQSSRIDLSNIDRSRIALLWSTSFGSSDTVNLFYKDIINKGPRFGKPILFPHTYANTAISLLSIEYRLNGPHINFASDCTASSLAITSGFDMIASGRVPVAFAGAAESFNETVFRYISSQNILSSGECRPFSKKADGTVMGEGAGTVVIEERKHAIDRKADILAEIAGIGMSGSSKTVTQNAIICSMKQALEYSSTDKNDIDCIIASANGIAAIDKPEAEAISKLFNKNMPHVTSVKPLTGETFGADGILQLISAVTILNGNFIPACPVNSVIHEADILNIPEKSIKKNIRNVMINNIDPNGNAISVIIKNADSIK